MALATSITTAARNAGNDAILALLNAGNEAGQLRIYSGTAPADVNAALSGNTLLAALTLSDPAFAAAVAGVATASAISSDTSADATGTATFFRAGSMNSGTFTPVIQGEVGTSGADLNLSSVAITAGGTVAISSWTHTQVGT